MCSKSYTCDRSGCATANVITFDRPIVPVYELQIVNVWSQRHVLNRDHSHRLPWDRLETTISFLQCLGQKEQKTNRKPTAKKAIERRVTSQKLKRRQCRPIVHRPVKISP